MPALKGKGSYTGRARRGLRAGRRVGRVLTTARLYPHAPVVSTFWWEQQKNFGDLLTPFLLPTLGIVPVHTPADRADLVGVGSLVQQLPGDFSGVLWGTGLVDEQRRSFPGATALALRGELTWDRLGSPQVMALGDPGLLLGAHVPRRHQRSDVGVVPHYVHRRDPRLDQLVRRHRAERHTVSVIDVRAHPVTVARKIAACRTIVTTSLHGLIVADALGIPATWLVMTRELYGGEFKFWDHESVARPARSRRRHIDEIESLSEAVAAATPANAAAIERAGAGLRRCAQRIPEFTPCQRLHPLRIAPKMLAATTRRAGAA